MLLAGVSESRCMLNKNIIENIDCHDNFQLLVHPQFKEVVFRATMYILGILLKNVTRSVFKGTNQWQSIFSH